MNSNLVYILIVASVFVSCSKQRSQQSYLQQVETQFGFRIPQDSQNVISDQWSIKRAMGGEKSTITIFKFNATEDALSSFLNSFSNKVKILRDFKPVKMRELAARAAWWTPHDFPTVDVFNISTYGTGTMTVYIAKTPTNKIVFVNAVTAD